MGRSCRWISSRRMGQSGRLSRTTYLRPATFFAEASPFRDLSTTVFAKGHKLFLNEYNCFSSYAKYYLLSIAMV
jgi:hypothetical protein